MAGGGWKTPPRRGSSRAKSPGLTGLSKISDYFIRFVPDLSQMILKSSDHGCQFRKILQFT